MFHTQWYFDISPVASCYDASVFVVFEALQLIARGKCVFFSQGLVYMSIGGVVDCVKTIRPKWGLESMKGACVAKPFALV